MEEWRQIDDTHYSVSNLGRVRNDCRGNILADCRNKCGYPVVKLGAKAQVQKVHRLVAAAFLGTCPDKMVVDHINRIKHDNRLENLRYVSYSENTLNCKNSDISYIKFVVDICRQGKKFRGSFDTLKEAEEFRDKVLSNFI